MADNNTIRIGRVSDVNYKAGTVRVVYADQAGTSTKELPVLSEQYLMPAIGDMVAVAHLSNGGECGVVLGKFFNAANRPTQPGANIFRKEFSNIPGEAYFVYDSSTGTMTLHCKTLNIVTATGTISVNGKAVP